MSITKVWTSRNGNWIPGGMKATETVLEVDVTFVSGSSIQDLMDLLIGSRLIDEAGREYHAGAGSVGGGQNANKLGVEYLVPTAQRTFAIWFPKPDGSSPMGEGYDLSPLLR